MYLPDDPNMLLSVINMKLRDEGYSSLDDLCNALDLDRSEIESKLNKAGFEYMPAPVNQFR